MKRDVSNSPGYKTALALSPIIAGAALLTTGLDLQFSKAFDSSFGNEIGLHFADITTQQNNFPGLDRNYIVLDALCTGQNFVTELSAYNTARSEVCVLGPRGGLRRRRNVPVIAEHYDLPDQKISARKYLQNEEKRNFWPGNSLTGSAGDRPFAGDFLTQVTEEALEVVYERIVHLGPIQQNHMLLESKHDGFSASLQVCAQS